MYTFQYNGYTLVNSTFLTIEIFEGWSRVELRTSEDYNTGFDGGNIWERKFGFRAITIKGEIHSDPDNFATYYSILETIQLAFGITNTDETLIITRPDGISKALQAKVVDTPLYTETVGENRMCTFEVMLKAGNPYFTDTTSTTTASIKPGISGGTPVPSPVPSPLGGSPNALLISNTGDLAIYPIFNITGLGTNATVQNISTGQSFQINTTIPAGQTLQAGYNNAGLFVTLNGSNAIQYLIGQLWQLQVGNNQVILSGSSYDTNFSLSLTYTQQYKAL